ncbi:hypothetical protein [Roseomonas indoligenes]|uniref:Uncharacterized protein n=1 Tax=Roseomonas indoligenes TaxID=2820811 RepID=A0A940S7Y6_9PROT|nr:hypothetical protein [Pararoseomonas indoligenes]MBP0493557.1 hypothetical protein [Pararoseomonas indoligenes]
MGKPPARAGGVPAKAPVGKAPGGPKPARPRSPAKAKSAAKPRAAAFPVARGGWLSRLFGGASWLGVAVIVLSVLVLLPIAAAVLGDIWAVIIGALIGGFALGRATAG